ncbi:Imm21 family immunity protein [Xanthomonas campestris]|uniref:Imm21 family immunity protein n=1 Tax=Xanthomonas campestris TaxID=339 RepID=UPI0023667106|nr:Imm21 family immunity protein [Xanthomonas campestris]WDJ07084.1 hypothetical protein JH261_05465 [Xanthomonas campestris pv. incanae]
MKDLNWIESSGGPLVLLHRDLLPEWCGSTGSVVDADATDYTRACDVIDELGVIDVGSRQALVLGDEPDRTALTKRGKSIFIIRWRWAPSEGDLLEELRDGLDALDFCSSGSFLTMPGTHLLFDSALAGTYADESSVVELDAAQFSLSSAYFHPRKDICALIHRLQEHSAGSG